MAPRRRCPTCGSRQWHKEPSSGLIACSEGHVLQNYRNETNEVDHYAGPHVLIKRTLKSTGKKKEKKKGQANPQLYHGARGRYHYFVCQQLILRMQIEAIAKLWNLPPEFETICRDVWSLHLSLLPDPPPPEPYSYLQERENGGKNSSRETVADTSIPPAITESLLERHDLNDEGTKDPEGTPESGASETEDDSEMEEFLRQNSEISSASEDEDPGDPARAPSRTRVGGQHRVETIRILESPASTLAILMIAFWILRIPAMYRDLARIIETHELPYFDPVRYLPSNMVGHLAKHSIQALSPHRVPSTLSVHKLTARLGKRFKSSYGVLIPECNAAPLLWRLIRSIGGTPTLYALAKRLAYILALPLTLHSTLGPGLKRIKPNDPERHKYDNVPPEVASMATIIIVLKMIYGLDGRPRFPRDLGDPALALPRLDEWLLLLEELGDEDANTKGELFDSENALAVGDLDEHMLDDYLDFCRHALIGSESSTDDTVVNSFFPVQNTAPRTSPMEVRPTRPRLRAGTLLGEDSDASTRMLRPAEDYTIWNAKDMFGTLPEGYQLVLGRAAKWVGIREAYLSGVVELYERRLARWWDMEKRRGKDGDESLKLKDRREITSDITGL